MDPTGSDTVRETVFVPVVEYEQVGFAAIDVAGVAPEPKFQAYVRPDPVVVDVKVTVAPVPTGLGLAEKSAVGKSYTLTVDVLVVDPPRFDTVNVAV